MGVLIVLGLVLVFSPLLGRLLGAALNAIVMVVAAAAVLMLLAVVVVLLAAHSLGL